MAKTTRRVTQPEPTGQRGQSRKCMSSTSSEQLADTRQKLLSPRSPSSTLTTQLTDRGRRHPTTAPRKGQHVAAGKNKASRRRRDGEPCGAGNSASRPCERNHIARGNWITEVTMRRPTISCRSETRGAIEASFDRRVPSGE